MCIRDRDLFNQPYVVIMCDEAGGKNNKNKVLKEAIDTVSYTHLDVYKRQLLICLIKDSRSVGFIPK